MSVSNALVIGGGISGLSAAAALAQRDVHVTLLEAKDKLGDLGGVGLSLMGNATKALALIGVAARCVEAGMPADHFTVRSVNGEIIATREWPSLGKPLWPNQIGISRASFHHILVEAATSSGVVLRCGITARSMRQDRNRVEVVDTDGGTGSFDLVVVADGLYSSTRSQFLPNAPVPKATGLAIWRAGVRRPRNIVTTQLHFDGPHGVVGICPISSDDSYVYCVHRDDASARRDPSTLHEQLREKLAGYGGFIPPLAAQLIDPALVSYRPLEWLLVPAPWFRGRVVLIGDAVHANPPNLAQGAAMGIEDAIVLAEEVTKSEATEISLARFMSRRWERVRLVVDVSRRIALDQVAHTRGFDAAAEMRRASTALAVPF